MAGVAAVGLGEHRGDHLAGVSGHAGGQPLARAFGPGGPGARPEDVPQGARGRGDDVDRAGLGHPPAGPDLALGQPPVLLRDGLAGLAGQLRAAAPRAASGSPCRRTTAPPPRPARGGRRRPAGIEPAEITAAARASCCACRVPSLHPVRPRTCPHAAPSLPHRPGRGHLDQPGRMPARRQAQLRIQRVHAGTPARPVRDPGHHHRPEHAGQRTGMPPLSPGPGHPVRARHPRQPRLRRRPREQVILQQPPLDLPAPGRQPLLQPRQPQPRRLRPGQPLLRLRERLPRPREHPSATYPDIGLLLSVPGSRQTGT